LPLKILTLPSLFPLNKCFAQKIFTPTQGSCKKFHIKGVAQLFLDQHVCFLCKLFFTPTMCNRMLVHSRVNGCFINKLKFMQNIENLVVTIIDAPTREL
jgi:hypothetical protein